MSDLLVYGKVILDSLELPSGRVVSGLLGGGGPQGALGARFFWAKVGFLTRTGADLEDVHIEALQALNVDLAGWREFPRLRTPRLVISYDEDQNMMGPGGSPLPMMRWQGNWAELLSQNIPWPEAYQAAKGIHLITELPKEQMVHSALELRDRTGALISLEPLMDTRNWSNLDAMMKLVSRVDVVCPDLPSALAVSGGTDPAYAAGFWHELGPAYVAVRAGSQGSFLAGRGLKETLHIPAMDVQAKDPTGAGNAYSGGLAASLLTGVDLALAACNATAAAAVMLEAVGMPTFSYGLAKRVQNMALTHYRQLGFIGDLHSGSAKSPCSPT